MSRAERIEFCRGARARHDAAVERILADPEVRAVLDDLFGKGGQS